MRSVVSACKYDLISIRTLLHTTFDAVSRQQEASRDKWPNNCEYVLTFHVFLAAGCSSCWVRSQA